MAPLTLDGDRWADAAGFAAAQGAIAKAAFREAAVAAEEDGVQEAFQQGFQGDDDDGDDDGEDDEDDDDEYGEDGDEDDDGEDGADVGAVARRLGRVEGVCEALLSQPPPGLSASSLSALQLDTRRVLALANSAPLTFLSIQVLVCYSSNPRRRRQQRKLASQGLGKL